MKQTHIWIIVGVVLVLLVVWYMMRYQKDTIEDESIPALPDSNIPVTPIIPSPDPATSYMIADGMYAFFNVGRNLAGCDNVLNVRACADTTLNLYPNSIGSISSDLQRFWVINPKDGTGGQLIRNYSRSITCASYLGAGVAPESGPEFTTLKVNGRSAQDRWYFVPVTGSKNTFYVKNLGRQYTNMYLTMTECGNDSRITLTGSATPYSQWKLLPIRFFK